LGLSDVGLGVDRHPALVDLEPAVGAGGLAEAIIEKLGLRR
jgi:hypothetical protein